MERKRGVSHFIPLDDNVTFANRHVLQRNLFDVDFLLLPLGLEVYQLFAFVEEEPHNDPAKVHDDESVFAMAFQVKDAVVNGVAVARCSGAVCARLKFGWERELVVRKWKRTGLKRG